LFTFSLKFLFLERYYILFFTFFQEFYKKVHKYSTIKRKYICKIVLFNHIFSKIFLLFIELFNYDL